LLISSMGMFIALIERMTLLQINRMLIFTGNQGRRSIAELYGECKSDEGPNRMTDAQRASVSQTVVHFGGPAIIQKIHIQTLIELAEKSGGIIEVIVAVGDSVVESTPLLQVFQSRQPVDETLLKTAVEVGDERTFEQDPKYALRLIVDIAIKALSPAINDPTTAVQALDQIEDILLRLGRISLDIGAFHDRQGELRLLVPFPTWDDLLHLALTEISHYGADSVQVMRRIKALIKNLTTALPPERRSALQYWEHRLQELIKRTFEQTDERIAASIADRQGLGLGTNQASTAPALNEGK
jgi:uncharacterized membrane protein